MSEAAIVLPHRPPYTVDDLFQMPDDGNRYEVFGGALHVSPAPAPLHQFAADELQTILRMAVRPHGAKAITGVAVRTPEQDGPIPDLTVTTADIRGMTGALPYDEVHSVVEIVSPSSTLIDRSYKRDLYAEAGIPCYWRVELKPSRGYTGAVPRIVVRLRDAEGWQTIEAVAGKVAELPLAVGRANEQEAHTIPIKIDPASLVDL
jgi:Uma2 family endonuclease